MGKYRKAKEQTDLVLDKARAMAEATIHGKGHDPTVFTTLKATTTKPRKLVKHGISGTPIKGKEVVEVAKENHEPAKNNLEMKEPKKGSSLKKERRNSASH